MTILPAHTQRIIFHKAMASAHLIAAEFDCAATDVIDIVVGSLLIPDIVKPISNPSQPGETSRSHAPAAQTDGAAEPPVPTEPSVDQFEVMRISVEAEDGRSAGFHLGVDLSGLAAYEQGPTPSTDASQERAQTATGLGAGGDNPDPISRPTATAKTDVPSDRGQPSGGGQSQDNSGVRVASVEPPPRRITNRQRVRECHEAHPDWTAEQIAADTGLGAQQVRVIASQTSLKLPKPSPAEPQEAVEPPPAPEAQPEQEQPPANTPVARSLPLPPPVVKPMQKGPQGRFYLRDKTTLAFVHQSLAPAKEGSGPMMTSDRKWAWYDTMERYRGAVKKWPELAEMRKEAASHV